MKNKTDNKFTAFKVKDISLAEWGRKEINLAEAERSYLCWQGQLN